MTTESKLRSFVGFAIRKLDAATESLQDEDPEDNFQELATFTCGMARHLRSVGSRASPELKGQLMEGLASVWDLRIDRPGPDLRDGGVAALKAALEALLAEDGPLAAEEEAAEEAGEVPENLPTMSFQDAVTYMWNELDQHRVQWGDEGFILDLQAKGGYRGDRCEGPLFTHVNKAHPFWSAPTTCAFMALLDNYERETGTAEVFDQKEKQEMSDFLEALGETPMLRFLLEYLKVHGKDERCSQLRTMSDLQHLLYDIWMAPYRRFRANDSSGFEHVFVGEEKRGKITGLHNWVQYVLEEEKGNINYKGWVGKQDQDYSDDVVCIAVAPCGSLPAQNIVTVKFAWEDDDQEAEEKPCSTILCGSTVEFEIALLTMAFLAGEQNGDNPMTLGSESINVKCYSQRVRYGGCKVGTAFIELA